MTAIELVLITALAVVSTACITWLWDFCLGHPGQEDAIPDKTKACGYRSEVTEGRIFSGIGQRISDGYLWWEWRYPNTPNPFKPLGVCPYCTAVWVGFGVTAFFFFSIGYPWWMFLPVASIGTYFYRKTTK